MFACFSFCGTFKCGNIFFVMPEKFQPSTLIYSIKHPRFCECVRLLRGVVITMQTYIKCQNTEPDLVPICVRYERKWILKTPHTFGIPIEYTYDTYADFHSMLLQFNGDNFDTFRFVYTIYDPNEISVSKRSKTNTRTCTQLESESKQERERARGLEHTNVHKVLMCATLIRFDLIC